MKPEEYDALLMEHSNSICYICDTETYSILHLTKAAMEMYGLKSPDDYAGQKCYELLQGLDAPCPFCTNQQLRCGENYCWEHYNEKLQRWMSVTDTLLYIDGHPCRMESAHDITAQKQRMSQLSEQLTVESVLIKCVRILVHERDLKKAMIHFLETIGQFYCARRAYITQLESDSSTMKSTFEWCAEDFSAQTDALPEVPSFLSAPLMNNGKITGFLGVDTPLKNSDNLTLLHAASDFIMEELEKRRLMSELEYASYTDMLTGLKNRNQYIRMLQEYSWNTPDTLGVIFIDINGMKKTNDTYGHRFGDYVITKVASIMSEFLHDNLFRIGGDEFVALCENISKEEFQETVTNLRREFVNDKDCDVSLGCIWRSGELDINDLILQADDLMYAEKQSYYHTVLRTGRVARTGMASEVLREITEDRFVVFYQPQFDIKSHAIVGAEALIRKKESDGTLIPPDRFIPFYEMEGVIRHVDLYVLDTVCQNIQKWQEQGISLNISVNFSRVTLLEPRIVDTILDICGRYNVSSSQITVEVTESISKMDHAELKLLVHNLSEAGFSISLDDFGSKYSNLSILTALDFDVIKFDKTLVDELEHNPKSQVVMQNSIQICQDLTNTLSIAEGIETRGQLDLLSDYACDYGQGYYFSRPLSLEQFDKLLTKHAGKF